MQILITVVLAAVAAIQTSPSAARVTRSDPVLVRSVIDGETIDVTAVGRIRLLGIDAPPPFERDARERLTQLVLHRWVRLEREGATGDTRSRRLAYVLTEDGVCVNAALVRDGLARVSARVPPTRLAELQHAEVEAQAFRRGMWAGALQGPGPSYTRRAAPRPPTSRTKTPAAKRRTTRTKKP